MLGNIGFLSCLKFMVQCSYYDHSMKFHVKISHSENFDGSYMYTLKNFAVQS